MNTRRHFLKRIAAAAVGTAAATVVDPELLEWEPGKKATFDLWMPPKKQLGISVRLVKEWEIDPNLCRLDVLYGMSVVRPELACRVAAEGDGSLEDIEGVIITEEMSKAWGRAEAGEASYAEYIAMRNRYEAEMHAQASGRAATAYARFINSLDSGKALSMVADQVTRSER